MLQPSFCPLPNFYSLTLSPYIRIKDALLYMKSSKNHNFNSVSVNNLSFRKKSQEIKYFQKMSLNDFSEKNNRKDQDISKDGGVVKNTIAEGSGILINDGYEVKLNYQGKLSDGRIFDSSLTRKKPFSFTIGEGKVISGWEIGIKSMKVGEKAKFYISSKYGYKKKGIPPIIPPNADLFFEIEIIDAVKPEKSELSRDLVKSDTDLSGSFKKYEKKKDLANDSTSEKFFFISPFSSQSGEKAPWWLNPNITFFLIFLLVITLFVVVYSLGGINQSFDNPNSILDSDN